MTTPSRQTLWIWTTFLAATFVAILLPIGITLWRNALNTLPTDQLRILQLVHQQVLEEHVAAHEPDDLLGRAIEGMVHSLDRHSRFVPGGEVAQFEEEEITGTYQGIGALMVRDRAPVTVQFPLAGGPAERAGVRVGDEILAIDGQDVASLTPTAADGRVIDLIKGPAGSTVRLTVRRGGPEPETLEVDVERAPVRSPGAKWARIVDADARIGYVFVADFQRDVTKHFDACVGRLEGEVGGPLGGLIVDLRGNRGGLLDEGVELANRFLQDGEIVSLKRRDDEVVETHDADPTLCTLPDVPLVVLTNGDSASASEVVAGALQDRGRARLVGTRTYGKGVVQSIYQWQDLDFRLKLTTSHYYTPSGRNIERRLRREGDGEAEGGIAPDVDVPVAERKALEIAARLARLEPPPSHRDELTALATRLEFEPIEPFGPDADPQLAAAIDTLRGG